MTFFWYDLINFQSILDILRIDPSLGSMFELAGGLPLLPRPRAVDPPLPRLAGPPLGPAYSFMGSFGAPPILFGFMICLPCIYFVSYNVNIAFLASLRLSSSGNIIWTAFCAASISLSVSSATFY